MSSKKRFGSSSFLLFSAICGIAGTSVASAAGESGAKKNVQDTKILQGVEEDAGEQTDLADGEEDDVVEDYSELESLLKETDEISWSLTKTLAVAIPTSLLGSIGTALFLNPELRKKAVETVFGNGSLFGSKDTIKEKTVDLEKMFDEWYAKRRAAEEKAEKAEKEKTEKAEKEKAIPSENEKARKRIMAWVSKRANRGIAFALGPRTRAANWVFGVLDRVLPKNVSAKLKGWFYLDDANENGLVFNVLYALALIYSIIGMFRLAYIKSNVLDRKYFLAPFHAVAGDGHKVGQRVKIGGLKLLDAGLRVIIPPYAFARAGLEFAGDMYYLFNPVQNLKNLGDKIYSSIQNKVKDLGDKIYSAIQKKVNEMIGKKINEINLEITFLKQEINNLENRVNDKIVFVLGKLAEETNAIKSEINKLQILNLENEKKVREDILELKGELDNITEHVSEFSSLEKKERAAISFRIDNLNSLLLKNVNLIRKDMVILNERLGKITDYVNNISSNIDSDISKFEKGILELESKIKDVGQKNSQYDLKINVLSGEIQEIKDLIGSFNENVNKNYEDLSNKLKAVEKSVKDGSKSGVQSKIVEEDDSFEDKIKELYGKFEEFATNINQKINEINDNYKRLSEKLGAVEESVKDGPKGGDTQSKIIEENGLGDKIEELNGKFEEFATNINQQINEIKNKVVLSETDNNVNEKLEKVVKDVSELQKEFSEYYQSILKELEKYVGQELELKNFMENINQKINEINDNYKHLSEKLETVEKSVKDGPKGGDTQSKIIEENGLGNKIKELENNVKSFMDNICGRVNAITDSFELLKKWNEEQEEKNEEKNVDKFNLMEEENVKRFNLMMESFNAQIDGIKNKVVPSETDNNVKEKLEKVFQDVSELKKEFLGFHKLIEDELGKKLGDDGLKKKIEEQELKLEEFMKNINERIEKISKIKTLPEGGDTNEDASVGGEIEEIKEDLKEFKEKVDKIEKETVIQGEGDSAHSLKDEINGIKETLKGLQSLVKGTFEDIKKQMKSLVTNEEVNSRLDTFVEEISKFQSAINEIKDKATAPKEGESGGETDFRTLCVNLQSEIRQLRDKVDELGKNNAGNEALTGLKSKVEELTNRFDTLKVEEIANKAKELSDNLEAIKQQIEAVKQKANALDMNKINEEIGGIKDNTEGLKEEPNVKKKNKKAKYGERIKNLEVQVSEIRLELDKKQYKKKYRNAAKGKKEDNEENTIIDDDKEAEENKNDEKLINTEENKDDNKEDEKNEDGKEDENKDDYEEHEEIKEGFKKEGRDERGNYKRNENNENEKKNDENDDKEGEEKNNNEKLIITEENKNDNKEDEKNENSGIVNNESEVKKKNENENNITEDSDVYEDANSTLNGVKKDNNSGEQHKNSINDEHEVVDGENRKKDEIIEIIEVENNDVEKKKNNNEIDKNNDIDDKYKNINESFSSAQGGEFENNDKHNENENIIVDSNKEKDKDSDDEENGEENGEEKKNNENENSGIVINENELKNKNGNNSLAGSNELGNSGFIDSSLFSNLNNSVKNKENITTENKEKNDGDENVDNKENDEGEGAGRFVESIDLKNNNISLSNFYNIVKDKNRENTIIDNKEKNDGYGNVDDEENDEGEFAGSIGLKNNNSSINVSFSNLNVFKNQNENGDMIGIKKKEVKEENENNRFNKLIKFKEDGDISFSNFNNNIVKNKNKNGDIIDDEEVKNENEKNRLARSVKLDKNNNNNNNILYGSFSEGYNLIDD